MTMGTLKNYIREVLEGIVGFHCFQNAYGYDVEITSAFIVGTHETEIFGVDTPIFEGRVAPQLPEITLEIVNDAFLNFSLDDFRTAIRKPALTSAYCRRSFEAIANAFGDKKVKYKNVQLALNLDEVYLQKYKDVAHNLRHGEPNKISFSWEEIKEQLLVAWEVSRRYMWYLSLKKPAQLPLEAFPLLQSEEAIFSGISPIQKHLN